MIKSATFHLEINGQEVVSLDFQKNLGWKNHRYARNTDAKEGSFCRRDARQLTKGFPKGNNQNQNSYQMRGRGWIWRSSYHDKRLQRLQVKLPSTVSESVVKWLRLQFSIERSDVRGPSWSVVVSWEWSNITQPRKITKKIACSS